MAVLLLACVTAVGLLYLRKKPTAPPAGGPESSAVVQAPPAAAKSPTAAERQATSAMATALLENANIEVRPPENILAAPSTPDRDPRGIILGTEEQSKANNELFRKSARVQHDLLEAVRKVYRDHPELVTHQERIQELLGTLQGLRQNFRPYQEALQANQRAVAAYQADAGILRDAATNAASPAAVAGAAQPDRAALEADARARQAAIDASLAQVAEAERALTSQPAWQAAEAESARLQAELQAALARDETVQSLKKLGDDLERRKKEVTKERLKAPAITAS